MATATLTASYHKHSWGGGSDNYPGHNTTSSNINRIILGLDPYDVSADIDQNGSINTYDDSMFLSLPSGTFPIHNMGAASVSGTWPPSGSSITSVAVHYHSASMASGSPKIKPYITTTGYGTTTGAEVTVGTATTTLSCPGGGSWTLAKAMATKPGVWLRSVGAGHATCTELALIVTYTAGAAAPTFSSATTNAAGTVITITFSKTMANPSGKHAEFHYKINGGTDQHFSAAALNATTTKIDLTCSGTAIAFGDTITVSYTVGTVVAADGGVLASFSGKAVTNAMAPSTITCTPGVVALVISTYAPSVTSGTTPTPPTAVLRITTYAPSVITVVSSPLTLGERPLDLHLQIRSLDATLKKRATTLTLPLYRR